MTRRGATLLEVIIATVVGMLVLSALYELFVGGLALFTRGQARTDIQDAGCVGLVSLSNDLRRSSPSTVTMQGDPTLGPVGVSMRLPDPAVTTLAAFTPAPSFVLYYFDLGSSRLIKKSWGNVPNDPVPLPIPDPIKLNQRLSAAQTVVQIFEKPNGTEHQVANNVERMTLTAAGSFNQSTIVWPDNDPSLANVSITVTLQLQKFIDTTRSVEEAVSTTVAMRNP